jgi:hypothetical protein
MNTSAIPAEQAAGRIARLSFFFWMTVVMAFFVFAGFGMTYWIPLARKVVHAKIGAVGTELFGGHRELDRLEQRVGCRANLRMRRRRPVPER